jgi:hypothetical protein
MIGWWIDINLAVFASELIIELFSVMGGLIKCFTTMGALFMLVFGVAIIAGSAYLFIHDDVFLGNS